MVDRNIIIILIIIILIVICIIVYYLSSTANVICTAPYIRSPQYNKCVNCTFPFVWNDATNSCVCSITSSQCQVSTVDGANKTIQKGSLNPTTCQCNCLNGFVNNGSSVSSCPAVSTTYLYGDPNIPMCNMCNKCGSTCGSNGTLDTFTVNGVDKTCFCSCGFGFTGAACNNVIPNCNITNTNCNNGKLSPTFPNPCQCQCNANWQSNSNDIKNNQYCTTCSLSNSSCPANNTVDPTTCTCVANTLSIESTVNGQTANVTTSTNALGLGVGTTNNNVSNVAIGATNTCTVITDPTDCNNNGQCSWGTNGTCGTKAVYLAGANCSTLYTDATDCNNDVRCSWTNGQCQGF